jgi:hypothetical protein
MSGYLPANFEVVQLQVGRLNFSSEGSFPYHAQPDEGLQDKRSKKQYAQAFNAYVYWCVNLLSHNPQTEGPVMARRLLGWAASPEEEALVRCSDTIDRRFLDSLDLKLAESYALALNVDYTRVSVVAPTIKTSDTKNIPPVQSGKKKKIPMSKVKRHSHAKPCTEIRDLATKIRSLGVKGHPAKALHPGTCGVCMPFQDCGNSKGILPPSLYKLIELAHLGSTPTLSALCDRYWERHRYHETPNTELPSKLTYGKGKRKIDVQSSLQVAKLPRRMEVSYPPQTQDLQQPGFSESKPKSFTIINGEYIFTGDADTIEVWRG